MVRASIPYVGVLHRSAWQSQTSEPQQCFPAAHASGGFALLALFFLFESPRNRARAVRVGLMAGWTMGAYKMAIGDHFLSHTVVSMLLAWLIVNLIVIADDWLQSGVLKGLQPAVNS
jgi:membrane-associated PAP2 superfamily phosphatase